MPIRHHNSNVPFLAYLSRPTNGHNMSYNSCSPQTAYPIQNHFPQSTRPFGAYDFMSPKPGTPQFRLPYQLSESTPMQSPQATRPHSTNNISYPYYWTEARFQYHFIDQNNVPVVPSRTLEVEESDQRETADDTIKLILELYEKLTPSQREQVILKIMNIATTRQRGLNVGYTSSTSGLDGPLEEELSHKLERFKIRTIKLGGSVKDEEKQK